MPLPLFAVQLIKAGKNVLGAALKGAKTSLGNRLAGNTQVTSAFGTSVQKAQESQASEPENKNQMLIFGGIAAAVVAFFIFKKK